MANKVKKEFYVKSAQEVLKLIKFFKKQKINKRDWILYRICYNCEICGKEFSKQLRSFDEQSTQLLCKKNHLPKKLTLKCSKCGKEFIIDRWIRNRKNKETQNLCKTCSLIHNLGGKRAYKKFCKNKTEKAMKTQLKRYGAVGNGNKKANEKRMKTIREKYGENYYSKHFKKFFKNRSQDDINKSNKRRIETNLKRYNQPSTGFIHALYKIGNVYLDSKYELYFYLYHLDLGLNIIREPIKLSYCIGKELHYYFPDFETDIGLVEIKSDFNWKHTIKEKKKCMKDNNVRLIKDKEIKKYKNYCVKKYGCKFYKQYKIDLNANKE